MKKGMVAPYPLTRVPVAVKPDADIGRETGRSNSKLPSRYDVLQQLVSATDTSGTILIASTGFNGRELYAIADRPNQLYMVGSMGCAASLGLGLSLVRPDQKIIVIDGDGAVLMRMGNLATVGAYGGDNFYHVLLDNHVHESTGGQATVSSTLDFQALATACAYRSVFPGADATPDFAGFLQSKAPAFLPVETSRGVPEDLPRPRVAPAEVARRLMQHLDVRAAWANLR
jgi:phosphonopyruvate decarboxylase